MYKSDFCAEEDTIGPLQYAMFPEAGLEQFREKTASDFAPLFIYGFTLV